MYETDEEVEALIESLHHFSFRGRLGRGGFGAAFLVYDESEKLAKVIKVPNDERKVEALQLEGENLVKLRDLLDEHIIQLYQYGHTRFEWKGKIEKRDYLLMAYGGKSLRDLLGEPTRHTDKAGNEWFQGAGSKMALERGLQVSIDVCKGLMAAHGHKNPDVRMVHRDIKPENILIDEERDLARIADFGVSRIVERTQSWVSGAGTPHYMDPECFNYRANLTSDIYSLGCVMYEIFTGDLAWPDVPSRFDGTPEDPLRRNPELPVKLGEIIVRCLERQPEQRYAGAEELYAELLSVSTALNPLPPRFTKLRQLSHNRFLCRDEKEAGAGGGREVIVGTFRSRLDPLTLERETAALEACPDARILRPREWYRHEDLVGYLLDPPPGATLDEAFPASGGRTEAARHEAACRVLIDLSETVAAAHAAGFSHGFLSPSLIWCEEGGRISAVEGYGLGALLREGADQEHRQAAAPFLSARIAAGGGMPGPADDVYSLGAVLFYLLTGKAPVRTEDEHWVSPRLLNPLVTKRLDAAVSGALLEETKSAIDFRDALRACRWPDDVIDGLVEESLEQYEQEGILAACELLNQGLREYPGDARLHYAKGVIYFREGDHHWAAEELGGAADVLFGDAEVRDMLARALAGDEQYEAAGLEMAKAIAVNPDDPGNASRQSFIEETRKRGLTSPEDLP